MCSPHIFLMNFFSFPNPVPGSVCPSPFSQYAVEGCRHTSSHTQISQVLVHTLSVYLRAFSITITWDCITMLKCVNQIRGCIVIPEVCVAVCLCEVTSTAYTFHSTKLLGPRSSFRPLAPFRRTQVP